MIVDTVLLEKGLKVEFNKAYHEAKQPDYMMVATKITSKSNSEKYGWIGDMPQLREWFGDRHVKSAEDHEYTIVNRKFEGTVDVDRDEIEDDQIGGIKPRIQQLAVRAKEHPMVLLSDLIANGTTGLAYDGAAFFSDRTVNDNLLAGSGVTDANLLTDLATGRATMMKFVDDNGEPLGITPDTVICPPELEIQFQKILQSSTYITATANGVKNVWAGSLKRVVVDYRLTDANDWYLLAVDYPLKPLIYQERKPPQFIALDKPTDYESFMRNRLLYGVDYRGNAGYGFYQQAIKFVNT